MTHYGINPSFCNHTSPLVFSRNLLRRGKRFEVTTENGRPTGEPSPLTDAGIPVTDGRYHGVRIREGNIGDIEPETLSSGLKYASSAGGLGVVYSQSWIGGDFAICSSELLRASWDAMRKFKPCVLRTLDWQMTNHKPTWSLPRVRPLDPLQGTERGMAIEHQIDVANALDCHLWLPVPARFELSVPEYASRVEELLLGLRTRCKKIPVIEFSNEVWNADFPVHTWLRALAEGRQWYKAAAEEINTLQRVAAQVFGEPDVMGQKGYYFYVGGQLTNPSVLDGILENLDFVPDMAGPAFYATPMKEDKLAWEQNKTVPTQQQLEESMRRRLPKLKTLLDAHREVLKQRAVPWFGVYEAGQSLIANHHSWRAAALQAQQEQWMGNLYREIRNILGIAGVHVCNWYSLATDQTPESPRMNVFGLIGDPRSELLPKAKACL